MAIESTGSDSDSPKVQSGENGHVRSNSVKKPASFKTVSVTKSFLKSAAGSTPEPKSTDKVSSPANATAAAATPASRLRLVAKAAGNSREPSPLSSGPGTAGGRGASEAKDVWNRNKGLAAAKNLTDEELKQTYGIHLASRLQNDESKDPKWADIDDDDEDWAPETIQWNDGTKVMLTVPDEAPLVALDSPAAIASSASHQSDSTAQSVSTAATSVSAKSTVPLKGALILKGGSDKPVLVAKPSQPQPVKSPWAQLPAVEGASPAPLNAGQRPPAQEMAADDFNRNWRDGQHPGTRELFIPQSGQYEPVNGSRRQRRDDNFRQASVLQRPSNDARVSADGSAAFQTLRSGPPEGSFSRRRTSSNVSGGSGAYGRRLSISKGSDGQSERRGSHVESSSRGSSPQPSKQSSVSAQAASAAAAAAVTEPAEDPVAMQQRIMKESIELARRRKKEQEERDEAERKKRIEERLKALGPAPEAKKTGADAALTKSPPQPSAPDNAGVRQLGVMKVHPAETVKKNGSAQPPRNSNKVSPPQAAAQPDASSLEKSALINAQPDDGKNPSYKPAPIGGEKFATWGAKSQSSNNPWGPPNERSQGLGNGTFDRGFGKYPRAAGPGFANGVDVHATEEASTQRATSGERAKPWLPETHLEQPGKPTPIGPLSEGASRWQNFSQNVQRDEAEALRHRNYMYQEEKRLGITRAQPDVTVTESWRDTSGNLQSRSYKPYEQSPDMKSIDAAPGFGPGPIGNHITQNRSSRFFPQNSEAAATSSTSSGADVWSDPPPTDKNHPAFGDEYSLPRVKLPALLEEPRRVVVRLPPQGTSTERRVVSDQPTSSSWQARFDTLVGKSPSVSHGSQDIRLLDGTLGPANHKTNFDYATQRARALSPIPVSLPKSPSTPVFRPAIVDFGTFNITRDLVDELFDDQTMGSLPRVNIPPRSTPSNWTKTPSVAALYAKTLPIPWRSTSSMGHITPDELYVHITKEGVRITIRLPGMKEPKDVYVNRRTWQQTYQPKKPAPSKKPRTGKENSSSPAVSRKDTPSSNAKASTGGEKKVNPRHSGNWIRRGDAPASAQPPAPTPAAQAASQ